MRQDATLHLRCVFIHFFCFSRSLLFSLARFFSNYLFTLRWSTGTMCFDATEKHVRRRFVFVFLFSFHISMRQHRNRLALFVVFIYFFFFSFEEKNKMESQKMRIFRASAAKKENEKSACRVIFNIFVQCTSISMQTKHNKVHFFLLLKPANETTKICLPICATHIPRNLFFDTNSRLFVPLGFFLLFILSEDANMCTFLTATKYRSLFGRSHQTFQSLHSCFFLLFVSFQNLWFCITKRSASDVCVRVCERIFVDFDFFLNIFLSVFCLLFLCVCVHTHYVVDATKWYEIDCQKKETRMLSSIAFWRSLTSTILFRLSSGKSAIKKMDSKHAKCDYIFLAYSSKEKQFLSAKLNRHTRLFGWHKRWKSMPQSRFAVEWEENQTKMEFHSCRWLELMQSTHSQTECTPTTQRCKQTIIEFDCFSFVGFLSKAQNATNNRRTQKKEAKEKRNVTTHFVCILSHVESIAMQNEESDTKIQIFGALFLFFFFCCLAFPFHLQQSLCWPRTCFRFSIFRSSLLVSLCRSFTTIRFETKLEYFMLVVVIEFLFSWNSGRWFLSISFLVFVFFVCYFFFHSLSDEFARWHSKSNTHACECMRWLFQSFCCDHKKHRIVQKFEEANDKRRSKKSVRNIEKQDS